MKELHKHEKKERYRDKLKERTSQIGKNKIKRKKLKERTAQPEK